LWAGGFFAFASVPGAVSGPQRTDGTPLGSTSHIRVTVDQNASDTVIDLSAVFAAMPGIHHRDGLELSILGNTNAGLVRTDLSEAALTLSYARGQCGTATITVGATDADGVSVQQTFLVTVRPLRPAGTAGVSPSLAGPQLSMTPRTSPLTRSDGGSGQTVSAAQVAEISLIGIDTENRPCAR
jgi:hypothetical protein